MINIILIVHVLLAAAVIGLVLIQQGKGADAGAAFGSGASSTVFGARGAASFLTRATAMLATLFFVTSLGLATLYGKVEPVSSVTDESSVTGTVDQESAKPDSDLPAIPEKSESDVPSEK